MCEHCRLCNLNHNKVLFFYRITTLLSTMMMMMMMMERIFEIIVIAMEEKLELFLVGGIERMRAGIVRNEGKYRTKKCLLVQQSRKKVKKERNSLKINRLFCSLFCLRRDKKLIKNKIFASFQAKNY